MKRVTLCSIILAVIIISSVAMLFLLRSYNRTLNGKIDNTIASWRSGDNDKTLKDVEELRSFWEKYYVGMSFIVQSDKLEHISTSIAKLKPLLECNNNEFYSECESIKFSVHLIFDSEFPKLHSVI